MRKLLIICLALLPACATITSSPSKKVFIQTNPAGATAMSDDGKKCTTPCTIMFGGYDEHQITIQKEGYDKYEAYISKQLQGRIFFNILFWPGFIVDFATGSAWKLNPTNINVELTAKK